MMSEARQFGWKEWWKNTIIYQIYPRSFMDADGDGVGDLKGITSRLQYFVDIDVRAIWISPIFSSPFADFGYDISDFKDIDPVFGTLDDYDALIKEAHRLGLKVILDFVPNHSSDQHPWFLESKKNRDYRNPYRDYYVWKDPKAGCTSVDPRECLPNNWIGVFGGSVWEWVEERQQFYMHAFLKEQPDLNYLDGIVRDEMKDVVRFWMERGADGLRVDAVAQLIEDHYMRDEPPDPAYKPTGKETRPQWTSLLHNYTFNHPEHHTSIRSWRSDVMDKYSTEPNYRFMMTETYDEPANLLDYYGTEDGAEADFPFNFQLISLNADNLSGNKVFQLVDDWMKVTLGDKWPNWVIGNHDNFRAGHRLGKQFARAANVLNLLLPGTPTTYYGEELGMEHISVTFEETQDPSGKNNPCCWEAYSRDPERSPMQWNTEKNAGFSTAQKTWLPVHENYLTGLNVESQLKDPKSMLNLYKSLAKIRKLRPAFHTNTLQYSVVNENIFSFLRAPAADESQYPSYLVAINFGKSGPVIGDYAGALRTNGVALKSNVGVVEISSNVDRNGEKVPLNSIELRSGEALVVRIGEERDEL
ncbi:maltase 1 [Strongylocentrotus purpuratus]|uniref:Glycosyl hydrolase family 13 catalytic domain-containing protein n=1 Tax=Strongylocentrotus purpuratus TaxID=7668 RepID=A0A7M7PMD3_STRPU|nr:maltase 1 [Strongylocentrotus purpuratus]